MRLLDLFSGIGGFALAAEWVWGDELEIVSFVEKDEFCRKVLNKHWPDVSLVEDVRNVKGSEYTTMDIISGGFPCQDISTGNTTGKTSQQGLDGPRSGLWFEFARIIGEVRPRFVVIENVSNLAIRGLDRVLVSLAEIGYNAEWTSLPAYSVGAPHKRLRIWIVAYPCEFGYLRICEKIVSQINLQGNSSWRTQIQTFALLHRAENEYKNDPSFLRIADVLPEGVGEIGSLGNSIVPKFAEQIFRAIKETTENE